MAGIGFRLQKLLSDKSLSSVVEAYLFSAIISTGPMIIVILTLAMVRVFIQNQIGWESGSFFMATVVYVYAFSMLGCGPFIYVVTRYIADRYYLKQLDAFTPTFISTLEVVFLFQFIVGSLFLYPLDLTLSLKFSLMCLYLFVNGTWIAMVFLSAAQNYKWIVLAFVGGAIISIIFSLILGPTLGLIGFFNGFAVGQGVTFFILVSRIVIEFGFDKSQDFGFIDYFKKHYFLVLIGIFYYLGIWIDKFVFWFSDNAQVIGEGFRVYSDYDTPMFLAYLTIVPTMAFFLIQIETSFVVKYWAYFKSIQVRRNLTDIKMGQEEIRENLSDHFKKFILYQGLFSGLVIFFIFEIAEGLNMNPAQVGVFRIGVLGAFLQMGFLMMITIMFYFDFQKEVFFISLLFFLTNFGFSLISLHFGISAYGYGFAGAGFVTSVVSYLMLDNKLKNLNYWTFMRQPISIPKFKFESESEK